MITIKSLHEIDAMKHAGRLTAEVFRLLEEKIKPGITTNELDAIAEDYIRSKGAIPSFKNYMGFPKSICTSINEQVIHGIPDETVIKDGDIVSIDIGVLYKGFHGDAARTFPVGAVADQCKKLIAVTKQSFFEGMKYAKEGFRVSDISAAIQAYAEENGYSVVRDYVGHGIGAKLHEAPEVPNFGLPGKGPRLHSGMTMAVEPMINEGDYEVKVLPNNWTVVTKDGCLSAHYENTVLITETNPQILTQI